MISGSMHTTLLLTKIVADIHYQIANDRLFYALLSAII